MSGVTTHGIRHPDGASPAKNLGPELAQMAEDLDQLVWNGTGEIAEHIVRQEVTEQLADNETVKNAAAAAVADELDDANLVRAFPLLPLPYTGNKHLPIQWVPQSLKDPVGDVVGETIQGNWVPQPPRRGDVPVLTEEGKLHQSQVPDAFATRAYVDQSIGQIPTPAPSRDVLISRSVPVFAGRVARARELQQPVAVVFAGSSTSAEIPGYITRLTSHLQSAFPVAAQSSVQWSPDAIFTENPSPGIHGYSAGEGGATANTYLTETERTQIAALNPAMIVHMVGANDYRLSRDPATYRSHLATVLADFDAKLTQPCQHLFVHSYPRAGMPGPGMYQRKWRDYLDALHSLLDSRQNAVLLDVSNEYTAVGVAEVAVFDNLLTNPDFNDGLTGWTGNLLPDSTAKTVVDGPSGTSVNVVQLAPSTTDTALFSTAFPYPSPVAYDTNAFYRFRVVARVVSGSAGQLRVRVGFHGGSQLNLWPVVPGTSLPATAPAGQWVELTGTLHAANYEPRDRMSVAIHVDKAAGTVFQVAHFSMGVVDGDRSDPLDLIRADDTHQTPTGYRFMADLLGGFITN